MILRIIYWKIPRIVTILEPALKVAQIKHFEKDFSWKKSARCALINNYFS